MTDRRFALNPVRLPRIDAPILLGAVAAFCVYLSMYAFRRPFSAAAYDDVAGWTALLDFKVVLVIAQVAGYALSKLAGIKLISELDGRRRVAAILGLIGLSWAALLIFAVAPLWLKIVALFLNGLPLGLIWGLVFSYLEGRRTSELLGAILCASFIVSSGIVKSVAVWLMASFGVSEWWMPAVTGILFMPLLLVSTLALARMPPPDAADIAARMLRTPMFADQRRAFLRRHGPGLALLVAAYVLFTALRDFRDNFAAELWRDLGYQGVSSVFTASELPVAVITLGALASLMTIRDNAKALAAMHVITAGGAALIGIATLAFQAGLLSPIGWMIASGAGLYLAYTPFNAMLFDRLIAATRQPGTAGFLIYVADAAGYTGSVALLLFRNLFTGDLPWLTFFERGALVTSVVGVVLTVLSAVYFARCLKSPRS
jgi:MFS family permease